MQRQTQAPTWARRLLPILVLAVGIALTAVLIKTREPPAQQPKQKIGTLVEVMEARAEPRRVTVTSQGTVQPQQQVSLSPQVPGKVIWVHPSLKLGGMVRASEALIKLDPVDYRLALEQARAAAMLAQKNLVETESNAAVARREWSVIGEQTGTREANPLALYEPQLALARANVRSAEAQIEQAKVNLSRTVIRAPFNLRVRSESVERGQYAVVGQSLATVYGTDQAEVIVPLPVAELRWIQLPRGEGRAQGKSAAAQIVEPSAVTLSMTIGGKRHARPGQLLRTVGEIDAEGRMAKIVVGLDDPYDLKHAAVSPAFVPEFQIGAFVDVTIEGRRLEDIVPIPATALRLGSIVWLADATDKLVRREVEVVRLTEDEALISRGLSSGDRVVLTALNGAVEGMPLRIKAPAQAGASVLRAEASQR